MVVRPDDLPKITEDRSTVREEIIKKIDYEIDLVSFDEKGYIKVVLQKGYSGKQHLTWLRADLKKIYESVGWIVTFPEDPMSNDFSIVLRTPEYIKKARLSSVMYKLENPLAIAGAALFWGTIFYLSP